MSRGVCRAGPYGSCDTGRKALPCCMHRYLRAGESGGTGRLPEDSVMCKGIIKGKQIFNTMNKFRKYFGEIYNVYGK